MDEHMNPVNGTVQSDDTKMSDAGISTDMTDNQEFVDALENNDSPESNRVNPIKNDHCTTNADVSNSCFTEGGTLANRLNEEIETMTEQLASVKTKSIPLKHSEVVNSTCGSENVSTTNKSKNEGNIGDVPGEDNSCDSDGGDNSDSDGEDAYQSADEGDNFIIDETNLKELEETLTEEERNERRKEAQTIKEHGNQLFKEEQYKEAVGEYGNALQLCPLSFVKDRSIMYSNRGACFMRLENFNQAIEDSSKAVELNPNYLKALLRRAELYEKTDKLDESLADFQKVVELDPMHSIARSACMRLPDQIKERNEKMKEEMLGKLKDLGNMILKPFGLSTQNFQLQQDPNSGGYSVQFNNNGNGK